ncbi:MAG: hypothetical protein IJ333_04640 [Clostridia bacterium]|nr:hypothetical protein [Clostridia bacterium]
MKLKNDPIFLLALLCLCWPIGLLLLIKSYHTVPHKWWMGICGAFIFIVLLTPAVINFAKTPHPEDFDLTITRTTLSVGQSAGLAVTADDHYYNDFSVNVNNDVLSVHGNTFTAVKPGKCLLSVQFEQETRTAEITVNEEKRTDETVYASPTGQRYHSSPNHAGSTVVILTEEEALQSGKTPCKICW